MSERDPRDALRHGEALLAAGRAHEALAIFDREVSNAPTQTAAHLGRGLALQRLRDPAAALAAFDRAAQIEPHNAFAHVNRAAILSHMGRYAEALAASDRALAMQPELAPAHCNRGLALNGLSKPDEALPSFDRAIELDPNFVAAHGNRGNALQSLARPEEALRAFERVQELVPDSAQAQLNASHALLSLGDFERGWPRYEWRKRMPTPMGQRTFVYPMWSGLQTLNGAKLLLHWEQGLGDTIQFCRYALLAQALGASVTLLVQRKLVRLMQSLGAGIDVRCDDDPAVQADYHCPLLSLPYAFRTTVNDVPAVTPYLSAEVERVRHWGNKIGTHGFKIGINWQGNKASPADRGRSFSPSLLHRIAKLPSVRLISLQRGDGSELLDELPRGMAVENLGPSFDEGADAFIDSAAVMQSLDLVITSDTAIAHLAGALARPVWVALQYAPDWRWMYARDDSPWYPAMRLFRQPTRGDWSSALEAMRNELLKASSF